MVDLRMKTTPVAIVASVLMMSSTTVAFGPSRFAIQQQQTNNGHGNFATTVARTTTTTKITTAWEQQQFASFRLRPSSSLHIATNDEVIDPSELISAKDDEMQQKAFALICGGVLAGSLLFLQLYNTLEVVLPEEIFAPFYTVLPYVLSAAFIAAGVSHFALEDTFTAFVPPKGSWGKLWQVPSPGADRLGLTYEQYHNRWSGIAEVVVGTSLIVTTASANGLVSLPPDLAATTTLPSALMWGITAAVTPANVYMYTHNPVVPRIPALPYPWGHGARGLLQCALLGVFAKLTLHSLQ